MIYLNKISDIPYVDLYLAILPLIMFKTSIQDLPTLPLLSMACLSTIKNIAFDYILEVFTDERTYMPESLIPEVATESDLQRTLIRPIKNRLPHVPYKQNCHRNKNSHLNQDSHYRLVYFLFSQIPVLIGYLITKNTE
ncbi:hypothetical protein EDC94DRAFT_651333 [Helicostylum pulchrum]|nr:hypothetical protein EDC94DRAFT_651333 [Helicostylum pulchrum]